MNGSLSQLERTIGYTFKDKELLETALTHRSQGRKNNERLEYLGDAVLGFVIADSLFRKFPNATEGDLTRLRSTLVRRKTLAELAHGMALGDYIRLGSGEMKSGGWRRASILANTFEAMIGAVYLDAGFNVCQQCIASLYQTLLSGVSLDNVHKDPKTSLQELLQSRQQALPAYTVLSEDGKAHERLFTVECAIDDLAILVQAQGRSKQEAEQAAAEQALYSVTQQLQQH